MILFIVSVIVIYLISLFFTEMSSKSKVKNEISKQEKLYELIKNNVIVKSKEYMNKDFTNAIVLDEVNEKIHFLSIINNYCETFNFDDLIETELIIDNDSITKTNRGSQLLGSVVGGIIAGTPGMIVGGLSSQKIISERIKNMSIKLTFNDLNNPIYKFSFFSNSTGISKDSHECKIALNFIERWYGYFTIILKQQNKIIGK